MTTSNRTSLLHLLSRISFELGDFTLSSGAKSDYYIVRVIMDSVTAGAVVHAAHNFTLLTAILAQTGGFRHLEKLGA